MQQICKYNKPPRFRNAFESLGRPETAVPLLEKVNSVIGVQSAHPQLAKAFPVNSCDRGYWLVQAIPFCRRFGIKVESTVGFPAADVDGDGVLCLHLRTTVSAGWGKRRQ